MIKVNKIEIFGDSVMKGIVMDKDQRYKTLVDDRLEIVEKTFDVRIKNRSIFGYTSQKGKALLDRILARGLEGDTVLIEYGGNDCNFRWEEVAADPKAEHTPITPLKEFTKLCTQMVNTLMEKGIRPVLMTLPPVDGEKYLAYLGKLGLCTENILKWLGDAHMIYRYQELYSNAIMKLATDIGAKVVDVRKYFLEKRIFKSLTCDDGLHPNKEGHSLILQAFMDFMSANNVNGRAVMA